MRSRDHEDGRLPILPRAVPVGSWGDGCLSLAPYVRGIRAQGRGDCRRRSFLLPVLQTLSTIISFRPLWFCRPQLKGSTALDIPPDGGFLRRSQVKRHHTARDGGLKRDFEPPKSGGRIAASLVRSRGGPNGPPSLVAGLLTFPLVGEVTRAH